MMLVSRVLWVTVVSVWASSGPSDALDNGLARTPPMGWMSWERYRCITDCDAYPHSCVSERLYMEMADRLSSDGWREAGYVSVHLDDCWMEVNRTAQGGGRLVADRKRFPRGIRALADYVHSKGLKLGIYADFGSKTCAGYPGSEHHLQTDANTFAEWGVDYLKLDGCYSNVTDMDRGYPQMQKYLNATGRGIVYSCSWPDYVLAQGLKPDYHAVAASCNLWRNYVDVDDSWASVSSIIKYYTEQHDTLAPVHGPGQWNDPDMLVVGDFGLSLEQQRSQMAMWSVFAAPLIMSNNLRRVPPYARRILLNKWAIRVNQDRMGEMGRRVKQVSGGVDIYTKAILPPGSYAVVFHLPAGAYPIKVSVQLRDIGLDDSRGYTIVNVFTPSTPHNPGSSSYNCTVNPTGVVMIVATVHT